jgi:hypothetical protein
MRISQLTVIGFGSETLCPTCNRPFFNDGEKAALSGRQVEALDQGEEQEAPGDRPRAVEGAPVMLAEIATLRALHGKPEPPQVPRRKATKKYRLVQ